MHVYSILKALSYKINMFSHCSSPFISGLTDMLPKLFQNIKDWCKTNISNQFTSYINMDKMSDFMNLCFFVHIELR